MILLSPIGLAIIGGGGGAVAAAPTGWSYSATQKSGASQATYTFSNFAVGSASASRVVVACLAWSHTVGSSISSVTIGGVSATLVQNQVTHSTTGRCAMYYAVVPSGTTADVVVNITTLNGGISCSVYYGYPATSTPLDSGVSSAASGNVVTVSDIQIATGGILIGFAAGSTASRPWSFGWSGADALGTDSEDVQSPVTWSARHLVPTENSTTADMTADPSSTPSTALIAASWGA